MEELQMNEEQKDENVNNVEDAVNNAEKIVINVEEVVNNPEKSIINVEEAVNKVEEPSKDGVSKHGVELVFKNVGFKMGSKVILENISGYVRPGEILALMGPSGAGKTSLLNYLSLRHELLGADQSGLTGTLIVNQQKMTKQDGKRVGYVMQNDILFETITLKETVEFYAKVKLPRSMKTATKMAKVAELIKLMSLENNMETLIGGGFTRGLSGGEKKRASIVVEMIGDPDLLFLDEPTSGLDSNMSMVLIYSLKKLATTHKKAIISSIHQPNSQIFFSFSKLLLLAKGKTAYFGPTPNVVDFFETMNYKCPQNWNAADHIIDMVRLDDATINKILNQYKTLANEIEPELSKKLEIEGAEAKQVAKIDINSTPTYFCQLRALTRRSFFKSIKERWTILNIIRYLVLAVIVGLVFLQTPINDVNAYSFFGLLFFGTINHMVDPLFNNVLEFNAEFMVVKKESLSGTYKLSAYYLAKVFSECPMNFVRPILMWIIIYWMSGLSSSVWFLASLVHMMLMENFGQSIGLLIGALGMSFPETMSVATVYFIFVLLVGGFYNNNLPYWLFWVKYLSPVHWAYSIQIWIQLVAENGLKCVPRSQTGFNVPSQLESCNLHMDRASPLETIRLVSVDIPIGYYVLLTFAFFLASHIVAYIMLIRSLKRPINSPSLEQRIHNLPWRKICCMKPKAMSKPVAFP